MKLQCAAVLSVWTVVLLLAGHARADLILDLRPMNYNPVTGVWTDASAAHNDALQLNPANRPTLVAGQTPSGAAVVRFDGTSYLQLTSPISSQAFTIFAYLRPTGAADDKRTVFGGSSQFGSFQYRIGGDGFSTTQEALLQDLSNLGHSTTVLPTTAFSNINLAIDGTGGTFRYNGAADGASLGSGFTNPSDLIGTRGLGAFAVESFTGDIAEILVYNTVLSTAQRATVEQQIFTTYAMPKPSSLMLASGALAGLAAFRSLRRLRSGKAGPAARTPENSCGCKPAA
jgi:Concanavalin A-like lectin/glucanases superfamily